MLTLETEKKYNVGAWVFIYARGGEKCSFYNNGDKVLELLEIFIRKLININVTCLFCALLGGNMNKSSIIIASSESNLELVGRGVVIDFYSNCLLWFFIRLYICFEKDMFR